MIQPSVSNPDRHAAAPSAGPRLAGGTPELIVFDWDGTLMDSTAAIAESIRGAAADLGLAVPSREQAAHVIGLGLSAALARAVPDLTPDRYAEFGARYREHYVRVDPDLMPFDGIVALLERLAAGPVPLAIATGKSRSGLNRALDAMQWRRHFVSTRCADEGNPKPDPWMLNDLVAELGVDPARCVMIGDTTHDLDMASAAGVAAIAVTYGAHPAATLQAARPLAMVDDVVQLGAALIALGADLERQ